MTIFADTVDIEFLILRATSIEKLISFKILFLYVGEDEVHYYWRVHIIIGWVYSEGEVVWLFKINLPEHSRIFFVVIFAVVINEGGYMNIS